MENKRYQIFISSTYTDLKEERAEVTQAILSINHMPYGMEAFPSANETQWEYIKRVIEESDYYIVIIGGKYGSVNPKTGISYTEMEYRYAEEIGIPLLAFIIDNSVDLPSSKTETDHIKKQKLNEFIGYIESKQMRKSYKNKEDLALRVITSLTPLFQQHPRNGWIRSDSLKSYTSNNEVIRLMHENEELKRMTVKQEKQPVLQQGSDKFTVEYLIKDRKNKFEGVLDIEWDEIFLVLATSLYEKELSLYHISGIFDKYIADIVIPKNEQKNILSSQLVYDKSLNTMDVLYQFEALGYISRPFSNYSLTTKGKNYFLYKKAAKK